MLAIQLATQTYCVRENHALPLGSVAMNVDPGNCVEFKDEGSSQDYCVYPLLLLAHNVELPNKVRRRTTPSAAEQ